MEGEEFMTDTKDANLIRKAHIPLWRKEGFQGYLFMIPTLIGFPLLCAYPILYSLYCAFCDWDGINPPIWTGLKNFKYILTIDPVFPKSLGVTFMFSLINVPVTIILGLALAILLNKKLPGIKLYRVLFYLPTIVPAVAAITVWQFIFKSDVGLLNNLLGIFHIAPVGWLTDEKVVLLSLSIIRWWGVGGMMIILLSGLQSVPADVYEAASLDGASGWQQFLYVTCPLITPVLFLQLITGFIGCMQSFTEAQIMTGGGPNYASQFISYDIFVNAFGNSKYGRACAEAWILFLIIMVLTIIIFKKSESYVYYENE
jgi:multiple sugar transport system permease protein